VVASALLNWTDLRAEISVVGHAVSVLGLTVRDLVGGCQLRTHRNLEAATLRAKSHVIFEVSRRSLPFYVLLPKDFFLYARLLTR